MQLNSITKKEYITLAERPFYSFQGEGMYTGVPALWIRTFGCNLKCQGFSQQNPKDPTTWINPLTAIDAKTITSLDKFPLVNVGCDSAYSWNTDYKHLSKKYSYDEIIDAWLALLPSKSFKDVDLCFTGGESMLWQNELIRLIYTIITDNNDCPNRIQLETNSTMKPNYNWILLKEYIDEGWSHRRGLGKNQIHFNISPKLWSVSGERSGINYENILFIDQNFNGNLKFVVNDTEECWKEMDEILSILQDLEITMPIYCMPVGASAEQQEDKKLLSAIVEKILRRKLKVSLRTHIYVFGNAVET